MPLNRRVAHLLLAHRGAFLALVAAATAVAALGIPRVRADFTIWSFLDAHDGEIERLRAFDEVFGDDALVVVIVLEGEDLITADGLVRIDALSREIEGLDHVEDVLSPTTADDVVPGAGGLSLDPLVPTVPPSGADLERIRRRVGENALIRDRLVAADLGAAAILVRLDPAVGRVEDRRPVVHAIRELAEAQRAAPGAPAIHLSGHPEIEEVYLEIGQSERVGITAAALGAILVLALAIYRNLWTILFPALSMIVTVIWTVGLMGWTGGEVDILTAAIPALLVVIGVADAFHLVSRYVEELRRGADQREALRIAVEHLLAACFLTSVTTSIGFASMGVAPLASLRTFGLYTGAGILFAYVVVVCLTPVLLSFVAPPGLALGSRGERLPWDRLFDRVADVVIGRPRAVVAGTVLAMVAAGWMASRIEVRTRALEEIAADHPLSVATRVAEDRLQGVLNLEVDLASAGDQIATDPAFLRAVAEAQAWLEARPLVTGTLSLVDLYEEMNVALNEGDEAARVVPGTRELAAQLLLLYSFSGDPDDLDRLVAPDLTHTHLSARLRDLGSVAFFATIDELRPELGRIFGPWQARGLRVELTGESVVANGGIQRVVDSLMSSLSLAFGCILVSVALLFRSWKVGLLSVVPNVGPVVGTLAVMALAGISLRMATSMICAVALGIAVDTTIHVVVRLRSELAAGGDRPGPDGPAADGPVPGGASPDGARPVDPVLEAAVRRALVGTGPPVLFTAAILVVGLGTMRTATFRAWVDFGTLGAIAVLISLWVGVVLTPALMIVVRPGFAAAAPASPDPRAPARRATP